MAKQICPHCKLEFDEIDMARYRHFKAAEELSEDFRHTDIYKNLSRRCIFYLFAWLVVVIFASVLSILEELNPKIFYLVLTVGLAGFVINLGYYIFKISQAFDKFKNRTGVGGLA